MYNIKDLFNEARSLPNPDNFFNGLQATDHFELPGNILLFFHDFCAPSPNAHHRYTLVFPFSKMRYLVDQYQYDVSPGEMIFLAPYQLRFLSPDSVGYQRFFITFSLTNPQEYLPKRTIIPLVKDIYPLLGEIFSAYEEKRYPDAAIALFHLLRTFSDNTSATEGHKISPEIANAIQYISENLRKPLVNEDVAKYLNMSASNLRRRFRIEMRMSMKNYILLHRVQLAQHFLKETKMRIDEISGACGYSSLFSFSHSFKNQTGFSPAQYRKNNHEKTTPSNIQ